MELTNLQMCPSMRMEASQALREEPLTKTVASQLSTPVQGSVHSNNFEQLRHNKADCTNPRVFTELQEGRFSAKANYFKGVCADDNVVHKGHTIDECEGNRTKDWTNVPDVDGTEAWNNMEKADKDKDIDEFKNWFLAYARKTPDLTFQAMEKALRNHKLNVHLVAVQKDIDDTQTIVNLEGKTGCTHQVQFQYSLKPKRKAFAQGWPTDEEDNMTKLADAGFVEDSYKIKCRNCDMFGHTSKFCTEEKKEVERVKVKCQNCDQEGHRVRDCPEQRKEKGVCRNCNEPGHRAMGHFAKDCPNSGGGDRACRNCGKEGHMAKECEEPRDPATVTCRNCDEVGHFSKECPKPRDYSRVKCSNCGEMGHTIKRCKQPVVGNAEGGGFGGAPGGDAMGMSGGGAGHNAFEASTTPAGW
ncbi:MAG: hypothetical protein M1833_001600 [Piccolia ochrophora]|nr:MAG: hypothetical protein M1833_001600 [Piccolia ochrophora]